MRLLVSQERDRQDLARYRLNMIPTERVRAFLENDRPLPDPTWLDTVNVPVGGSVDVIMDFTDPVIRGMSLFHCHLLNHEDKGMMAKILFE